MLMLVKRLSMKNFDGIKISNDRNLNFLDLLWLGPKIMIGGLTVGLEPNVKWESKRGDNNINK